MSDLQKAFRESENKLMREFSTQPIYKEIASHNEDNRPEAILDRVLEKTGTVPSSHNEAQKTNEEIVEEFARLTYQPTSDGGWNDPYFGIGADMQVEWLRTILTLKDEAHRKEMEEARDHEARLWFETWYSHYIAPQTPLPGEFGKFAVERIQMTGYQRDHALTTTKEVTEEDTFNERTLLA